jgi:ribulose-5-phosphate 4-epimerase/fuculose-1-phosphate aldolase
MTPETPMPDATLLNPLCEDLALALRAAAHHGLSEGVCNHFSVALPDDSRRFLINPRGLHWSEIGPDDIVLVDEHGTVLQGRHRVEPTAMFIHAAAHRITGHAVVLHTHMPYATALTLTADRALDTALSQNAMRFHGRVAVDATYNGLALDASEGERIARAMTGRDWMGLAQRGDYDVVGVETTPLLPGVLVLLLGIGGLMVAWRREGRA